MLTTINAEGYQLDWLILFTTKFEHLWSRRVVVGIVV